MSINLGAEIHKPVSAVDQTSEQSSRHWVKSACFINKSHLLWIGEEYTG